MDLSAVIFVALALGWAAYLIPRALRHHDETTATRLDEHYSGRARVLKSAPAALPVPAPAAARAVSTAAGRNAARRRRRVLYVLLAATALVFGFTWFAHLPSWAPAVPAGAIVVFLVVARRTVRRAHVRRAGGSAGAADVERAVVQAASEPSASVVDEAGNEPSRTPEHTVGVDLPALQQALADEGSLWDPVPVTLPTYVEKATARRTVRAIDLTGISSSGHDAADSELARQTEVTADAADDVPERATKAAGA